MFTRRQALGVLGMTAAASVLAADSKATWVDSHSHIWTRDLAKYPLAGQQTVADLKPASFTAEELLELAGKHGVGRVVLIQHKPYHGLDNSYITDSIAKFPGKFSGVACIEAEKPQPEADMDKLFRLGMRGFRIRPGEGRTALWKDSVGMCAMWAHAAKQGSSICPLIGPDDLPQVETLCTKYPDTSVVIDHFARIGMMGAVDDNQVKALCDLAKHKHVHVKISAYYALGAKKPPHTELIPMIKRLLECYGPARLMWGSDSPYQIVEPNTYGDSVKLITERCDFLSASDRELLLRGTAEKVFFQ
jgi:predicted TIM-barrel fold metal-dependent hydrolase